MQIMHTAMSKDWSQLTYIFEQHSYDCLQSSVLTEQDLFNSSCLIDISDKFLIYLW